jgi:rod shape-determining protein MreC
LSLRPRTGGFSKLLVLPFGGARLGSAVFLVMAFALFLISFANPQSTSVIRMAASDLFAPAIATINAPIQKAAEYVHAVTGLASLQAENARLLQENTRLKEWYQTAQQLQSENTSLRGLLNLELEPQHSYVTAQVVADSGSTFVRSLLVMAGQDLGVTKGQAAVTGEGVVGRVVENGKKISRVLLITDLNSRIPVTIEGKNWHAILSGTNEAFPSLVYLPPDAVLSIGDRIVTSGHGGLFPMGLPVGEVVRDKNGVLRVEPFASLDRLTYVRLVNRKDASDSILSGDDLP